MASTEHQSILVGYLKGGFSGNIITRYGDRVIKQGKTVGLEYLWYKQYKDKGDIPVIHSYKEGSLCMEYINTFDDVTFKLNEVMEIVERYKKYPPIGEWNFQEYRDRIANHLKNNPIHGGDKLKFRLQQIDLPHTFAHGDLSVLNILHKKLIDPLYGDRFGSYMLDYAKLAFTLKFFVGNYSAFDELNAIIEIPPVLIASECVRVATYNKRFSFVAENLINEL